MKIRQLFEQGIRKVRLLEWNKFAYIELAELQPGVPGMCCLSKRQQTRLRNGQRRDLRDSPGNTFMQPTTMSGRVSKRAHRAI